MTGEIKPTLELFIQESAEKVVAIVDAHPGIRIYGFFANRVEIGQTVLYKGGKLFAPEPHHIYRLLSHARKKVGILTVEQQDADIKRAMQVANSTRFDEWRSSQDILLEVIDQLQRNL